MREPPVLKTIRERFSVRDYLERPIEEEKLALILEAARLAPSASNSQPWHFHLVRDREMIRQLGQKMPIGSQVVINSFIARAPLVIVATAGPFSLLHKIASFIVNKRWYYLDVAIALEHLALAAWELGIGSCWIGWFDEMRIRRLLDIPGEQTVVALMTLGYPPEGSTAPPKSRKPLSEIVNYH